jgi:hypothetical protein
MMFGITPGVADKALAQQPDTLHTEPQIVPSDGRLHRMAVDRGERLNTIIEPRPLRKNSIRPTDLQPTPANLFTRAGADLAGVGEGSASIADVDGDGDQDILIAGARFADTTTLYLQQDDGTFLDAEAGLPGLFFGPSTSIADVDGDGDRDILLVGESDSGPSATLYLQQMDGTFEPAGAGLIGVSVVPSSSIADVDGDGDQDLLITGQDAEGVLTATLYLQNEDRTFDTAGAGLTGVTGGSSEIADIDGDGDQDFLITGITDGSNVLTTLYLQEPGGSFVAVNTGLPGVYRGSSSIADIDGDNDLDILLTGLDSQNDGLTDLFLRQPDGTFAPAGANLTDLGRSSSSIGDFDDDGDLDLLLAGQDSEDRGTATVYLQQADGGFEPTSAGLTGVTFSSTSVADIDGDGDQDLLITGNDGLFGEPSARLYVNRTTQPISNREPRLSRSLVSASQAAGTAYRARVEFGDLDGDRLALQITGGSSGDVSFVDAGNGTGEIELVPSRNQIGSTFTVTIEATDGRGGAATTSAQITVPDAFAAFDADLAGVGEGFTGGGPSASIADVNGDGAPDLLVTGDTNAFDSGGRTATLYLQQPDGSFNPAEAGLVGVDNSSSSIADVDGDGDQDLLITGEDVDFQASATLYLQQPNGSFSPADAGLTGVDFGPSSPIADIDGDGDRDILITGFDPRLGGSATIYLQGPGGTFSPAQAGLTGVSSSSSSIADVDGDGDQDLLITGNDFSTFLLTATLYLQGEDGSFTPAEAGLEGVREGSSSIDDIDGDGDLDLLITGFSEFGPSATIYLQQEDGTFLPAAAGLEGVGSSSHSVADADGDGDLDLLLIGFTETDDQSATLYLQEPTGTFTPIETGLINVLDGSASFSDIDGDGDPDPLVTGAASITNGGTNRLLVIPTATLYENLLDPAEAAVTRSVSSGASAQVFPGSGLEIRFSASTSGGGPVRVVKYGVPPSQTFGLPSGENISQYRFVIDAGPNLQIGNDTELRFDVSTLAGTPDPGNIDVYRRNPPGPGVYGTNPGSSIFSQVSPDDVIYDEGENVLSVVVDAFSEFVFTSDTNPLPVELADFRATGESETVTLTWQTLSETNNDRFEIERLEEGGGTEGTSAAWSVVGTVAGAGTTSEPQSYRFTDTELPYVADRLTYRLRQVDTDGAASLTKEVTVHRNLRTVELLPPFPNPVRQTAIVRYATPRPMEVSLRLYDVLGRVVRTLADGRSDGRVETPTDLSDLSSGVYFLRLEAGNTVMTRRLSIVR